MVGVKARVGIRGRIRIRVESDEEFGNEKEWNSRAPQQRRVHGCERKRRGGGLQVAGVEDEGCERSTYVYGNGEVGLLGCGVSCARVREFIHCTPACCS